tara:strand:+ start:23 stop:220 length:198 start_codon:yes stop_codon:yes gene_type:complete
MSIDKNNLPIDATNTVLSAACDASISILLNAHRNIDEEALTEAYQFQDMLQRMIIDLEYLKENGE